MSQRNPHIDRWNNKYQRTLSQFQIVEPRPEPELAALADLLPTSGRALEIACGKGASALYLAQRGLDVIAADFAFNGLVQARRSAEQAGINLLCLACDIERYPFPEQAFQLVSVVRYLNRALFARMADWVAPGGLLFYKTFNTRWLKSHTNFNPDYVVGVQELESAFPGMELLGSSSFDSMVEDADSSFVLLRKPAAD